MIKGGKTPFFKFICMKSYLHVEIEQLNQTELIVKINTVWSADGRTDNVIQVNDDEYSPTKGDKLYFLPGVNVPRVKLKDLSLQYGIKTVRDIDQATHVFAGYNTKDKITTGNWYHSMPVSSLQAIYDNSEDVIDGYYRENIRQALEFYTEDIVVMSYSSSSTIRNSGLEVLQDLKKNLRNSNIFYIVDEDYTNLFPKILTLDIFNENKLLQYINGEDATVIDGVMFTQLSDMFKSSDQDNHVIAMEIMANCNYIDSLLYIEMLFNEYAHRIADSNTKNHVNFKSLLSFLNKSKGHMHTDVDEIVESLIDKDVFDLEKVKVLMQHYGEEIANRGGVKYFEVKSLTLNEEAAKLLNTNYVHEIMPDFIPEGEIQVEIFELHGDLHDLKDPVDETGEIEISDEDIEDAFTRIERNELKSELIAVEEENHAPESELNEKGTESTLEENESNNNQIEQTNEDDFEWF
jgi:hypothetical protein